jgi:hypothetical protein
VTLRRIDARFLLPHPVRRAVVLPGIDGWEEELERANVAVGSNGSKPVDLAVGPADRAAEAAALKPRAVILEGRGGRGLARAGFRRSAYLPLPRHFDPLVFVPLGESAPARYAVEQWAFGDSRRKVMRNRILGALAGSGLLPPVRPEVVVAAPNGQLPFVVRAAFEVGLPEDVRPLLLAGQGDDYSRATFLLFEPDGGEPSWALKFARLPVRLSSFEREKRGLELARSAGRVVAARAPRWLGSFEAEGLQCTLESAARGKPLVALLRSSPDRAEKERAVARVCAWLLDVARETRAPNEALEDERRRLADDVLPSWGFDRGLVDELPALPAVLQHNDVGSWNVVVSVRAFTVLDWEDAARHGLPLWDLFYFLADASLHLDGATDPGDHFERLFLGEAPSSELLFSWTRTMVEALELSAEAVGRIATLCWLQHGVTGRWRAEDAQDPRPRPRAHVAEGVFHELAERWLQHPDLGVGWSRWAR